MLFNVRVYGVLINERHQVLVSDEYIRGQQITKFPGGGLEFGEGTLDCLRREFREEMNLAIEVQEHLYTTDFFQISAFNPQHQILSIYYKVKALEPISVRLSEQPFDFDPQQLEVYEKTKETESFRFIDWQELTEEKLTLPIDKVLVRLLKRTLNPLPG
ncbi:MAG TPA: NUDIX domain-containing protein [Flavisolibacter sp.]|jgi:ADP-ribose pyrophosphatase YjhB (NUDIX family)|nr:NUDIX domain-containing protein [Flavisolibacter sp.]